MAGAQKGSDVNIGRHLGRENQYPIGKSQADRPKQPKPVPERKSEAC
jgi:hypothetical protein